MFQTRVPTSAGARGSRQKKKRPGRAVAATGVPSVLKRRTQTLNFIPTDHIQRHRLPGPKRFEPPVFALSPQSTFCISSTPGYTTQQPTAVGVHGGSVRSVPLQQQPFAKGLGVPVSEVMQYTDSTPLP